MPRKTKSTKTKTNVGGVKTTTRSYTNTAGNDSAATSRSVTKTKYKHAKPGEPKKTVTTLHKYKSGQTLSRNVTKYKGGKIVKNN